ncbi:sulfotransferase [uncultured Draconibacterium sp.]|uniref:sulfotransferase family protein n=1 Tax=uncultured Draconibacterium sp. TaxID=1573823 RepID=UPI0025F54832|nr:sulfotransferase [uncultured Draconibacterium sp.]
MRQEPTFIVGVSRSGTTLLTQLINASGQIYFGTETHFFRFINQKKYRNTPESEVIKKYLNLRSNRFLSYFPYTNSEWEKISEYSREIKGYAEFFEYLASYPARLKGINRYGEKTPSHFRHIEQILEIFPNAKIINITRDPRAVFQSHLKVDFGTKSPLKFKKMYSSNIKVMQHYKGAKPKNFISIKYEDLLENPHFTLKKVCEFIEIKYTTKMLSSFNNSDTKNFITTLEPWKNNTGEIEKSKIYSWQICENKNINSLIYFLLKNEIKLLEYETDKNYFIKNIARIIKYWMIDFIKLIRRILMQIVKIITEL